MLSKTVYFTHQPTQLTLTPEEVDEYEEGYKVWVEELQAAIDSGDQARIDQVYEDGA